MCTTELLLKKLIVTYSLAYGKLTSPQYELSVAMHTTELQERAHNWYDVFEFTWMESSPYWSPTSPQILSDHYSTQSNFKNTKKTLIDREIEITWMESSPY